MRREIKMVVAAGLMIVPLLSPTAPGQCTTRGRGAKTTGQNAKTTGRGTKTTGQGAKTAGGEKQREMNTGDSTGQKSSSGQRAKPTGANLSDAQKQNLLKLQGDLKALQAGMDEDAIAQYTQEVQNDLEAIVANGVSAPSPGSIKKLAEDLVELLTNESTGAMGRPLSASDKDQLGRQIAAILDSMGVTYSGFQLGATSSS